MGYSAAVAESAATAATAAAPPRTNEEIRIETPCFYQTGIDHWNGALCMPCQRSHRPLTGRSAGSKPHPRILNANHSQYWASLSLIARENKSGHRQNPVATGP